MNVVLLSDMWTELRDHAHSLNCSDRLLFTATSLLIIFTCFYVHGWIFVFADWNGILDKYAIRSGDHKVATLEKQLEAIKEASIDMFVVKPMVLYFSFPFVANIFIQFDCSPPSLMIGLIQWIMMKLVFATSLYWLHRAMHHKAVYKYVHKRHHSYHDSVAFASQYAHPIEGIVSSLHVIFAIVFVKPHFVVYCAFLATTMIEIVDAHCGYDVPWAWLYPWSDKYPWGSGARAHDFHHSHNVGIYGGGLVGLWDRALGTDADFRKFEMKRLTDQNKNN